MREARRRSSGDSELVKTLRQELEDTHAKLRKLAQQTCAEKVSGRCETATGEDLHAKLRKLAEHTYTEMVSAFVTACSLHHMFYHALTPVSKWFHCVTNQLCIFSTRQIRPNDHS